MGLLKHLLFWPVTGPSFLARFSLEKVGETVRRELTDEELVKEELLALQLELELGDVTDEEYVVREAELMKRLREVREWREQFGMETRGGVFRVPGEQTPGSDPMRDVASGSSEISIELGWDERS
jgi:hypothetical protein